VASIKQVGLQIALCIGLFAAGVAVGSLRPTNVAAQNKFGQPKTVLHVVVYKFKDATSENDRQKALDGIKDLSRKIPGVKKYLAENKPQPDPRLQRRLRHRVHQPGNRCRLRGKPRARSLGQTMGSSSRKQPIVPNHQPLKILGRTN